MIRGYDSLLSISVNTCEDIRLIISFATGTSVGHHIGSVAAVHIGSVAAVGRGIHLVPP